ncbi:MAG: helix-turn-helix transcriptional regulator [Lachnospiraceae bacterium]|jgi:putative transcriptional regulator|nr:helix-turn-helix transcriptional regulator [Lachnospiraceae bacterium]MCI1398831.1 helix-turn-helix transcriptional regulator [Lachnospiraceae bacterium]MCI1424847.1 helix-turn-helix transcriptional regulator [Lachnospiraceae bacterium]MCI1453539.1 helix-turn-helix transcriptional regulator [Lachnospiraceae bacterium]MDD5849202.1 helix-turn-helix transcriptional regulator [Bacillota bacterium]
MSEPANNLMKCRKEAGISRSRAASELQVSAKTLYRYEHGTQCPNVYMAIRLAEYYHQTVQELFPPTGSI